MKSKKTTNELLEKELTPEAPTGTDDEALAVNINEFTSGLNYEHSLDKYKDNMSTAVTFFLCGIGGIVLLVLNWFGVINLITGKDLSSMVIYISLLLLFIIFIGIAIYSIKIANKVKTKIKAETNYTDDIREWVDSHIVPEVVDASYNSKGLPSEIKYFERNAIIMKAIKTEFPDAPNELIESITDEYIEEMFHSIERAMAEEAEDEEYDDDTDASESSEETTEA